MNELTTLAVTVALWIGIMGLVFANTRLMLIIKRKDAIIASLHKHLVAELESHLLVEETDEA